jgi:iron complex transport system permease protein
MVTAPVEAGEQVREPLFRPSRLRPWAAGTALLVLLAAWLAGVLVGPAGLAPGDVLRSLGSHLPFLGIHSGLNDRDGAIVWQLRVPRVVLGALVGGMLSLAGATYQGVFRNPLADPYLLGSGAGAGLGATLAIVYGHNASLGGIDLVPIAAFAGASLGVTAAWLLGRSAGVINNVAYLALAGVAVTAFLTAVQTFVQQRQTQSLQEVYTWILGRLQTAGWSDVRLVWPYVVVCSVVILCLARRLDVLRLGDDEAASLGLRVGRTRLVLVAAATLGTAAVVAVSGLIGFVGLVIPHAIRLAFGTSYRIVLPLSLVLGAAFLVLADVLARELLAPAELPIGVVTAFFGAPFFLVVLHRASRRPG